VDESAESVSPLDLLERRRIGGVARFRSEQRERAMWALAVVVGCVDAQDMFEMATSEDQ
jgi:hypothetical protein